MTCVADEEEYEVRTEPGRRGKSAGSWVPRSSGEVAAPLGGVAVTPVSSDGALSPGKSVVSVSVRRVPVAPDWANTRWARVGPFRRSTVTWRFWAAASPDWLRVSSSQRDEVSWGMYAAT